MYLSLHCHYQNDFCIEVGSDESHFSASLIIKEALKWLSSLSCDFALRDKITRQCP